jgi:transcriptional regulator with XRE-family HTH domain
VPIITDEAVRRARQLCNQLAIHRLAHGLTQRDIAAHFGDQQSNVQTIETMGRRPVLPTFVSYAWALDLDVALVAEHHLPLLQLTVDEIDAIRRALMQRPITAPHVSSALDKLAHVPADPTA